MMQAPGNGQRREEGSALVETALSITVLLTVMIGIMQLCLVMYASVFVDEAAREATRYASVRGDNSCTDLSTFPNCNLGPTTAGNPLQTYVQGLGYPLPNKSNLTVTPTWWAVTQDASGYSYWTTACTGATSSTNNEPCNEAGNMVKVLVQYQIPLNIPFWKSANVTLSSKSSMLIAN
jgi:Flp pilus assembly protein TadG